MQHRALALLVSCFLAAGCGAATDGGGAGAGGGSASFTVTSSMPSPASSAGASYSVSISFTTAGPACATTTIGACTVNPCYTSSSSGDGSVVLPNTGLVTLLAQTVSLGVEPQSDGTYASESVAGELPWQAGGDLVTFQWAHFPGETGLPGDAITLGAPPYVTLAEGSAFFALGGTVVRADDLTVSWTSDTTPSVIDDVAVSLISGGTQTYCTFNAGAGSGVVPAAALAGLEAGVARYSVASKVHASESISDKGDAPWGLSFNVVALASTSYGLAQGPVTIE